MFLGTPGPHSTVIMGPRVPILPVEWGPGVPILGGPHFILTPDLQTEARERLALNQFLSQLDDQQVAFAVKQRAPSNLDAAVSATLEMESYMTPKVTVSSVEVPPSEQEPPSVGAVSNTTHVSNDKLVSMLEKLVDRLDKLETSRSGDERRRVEQNRPPQQRRNAGRQSLTCWNCGKLGHLSRQCRSPRNQQEN